MKAELEQRIANLRIEVRRLQEAREFRASNSMDAHREVERLRSGLARSKHRGLAAEVRAARLQGALERIADTCEGRAQRIAVEALTTDWSSE